MKSQRRRTFVSTFASSLILVASPMAAAFAQDPVAKPVNPSAGTGDRLPAPRNISAVQLPDGRIRVTWSPVAGATSYALVRSVPPEAAKPITPNVTDTLFFDSDIAAGKTYYYLISGLNDAATGLRQGSAPVKATRGVDMSGSYLSPTNVVARYDSINNRVDVSWVGPSPASFHIERDGVPLARVNRPPPYSTSVPAPAPGTRVRFRISTEDPSGYRSPWVTSNEVIIPASAATPSGSTSQGPTSTTGPAGTVAVTIGSAVTMRLGGTASASAVLGGASASRWVSMDEGVATVDGGGTVTARAAGRARILAIAAAGDGSVRVTLVQVTVSP